MLLDQQIAGGEVDGMRAPATSPTLSPQEGLPLSPSALFMDEDVTFGAAAPRLSANGVLCNESSQIGGSHKLASEEEVTLCVPIPTPAVAGKTLAGRNRHCEPAYDTQGNRRESVLSNTSDGDITHQMPAMNDLIDFDEAYDAKSMGAFIADSNCNTGGAFAEGQASQLPTSTDDLTMSVGDVTSEAMPLASLLAADTDDGGTPERPGDHAVPESLGDPEPLQCRQEGNPKSASPIGDIAEESSCRMQLGDGRQSVGDVTLGMPSLGALADSDESSAGKLPEPAKALGEGVERSSESVLDPTANGSPISRPVLPPSRKLFSSEHQGDEDTTIHYHDTVDQRRCGNDSSNVPVNETLVNATDKDASFHETDLGIESDSKPSALDNFCDSLGLIFRHKEFKRCGSMGQALATETSDNDHEDVAGEAPGQAARRTAFRQLHAAARGGEILGILEASVKRMQDQVATRQAHIEELSRKIEEHPPRYFSRLAGTDRLKPSELSKMQLEFKRLQKASAKKAAKEHAKIRQERESAIAAAQERQVASIESERDSFCTGAKDFAKATEDIAAYTSHNALSALVAQAETSQVDSAVTATLRSEVSSHVEAIALTERSVGVALRNVDEMQAESKALEERNEELMGEVRRIRSFAHASSKADLVKLVAQNRDSHLLLGATTGIVPLTLTSTDIHLRLLAAVDVRFALHGNEVTSVNCSLSDCNQRVDPTSVFGQFVNRAVDLVSERCLKRISVVDEIASVLQLTCLYLMQVFKADYSLRSYGAKHEVALEAAGLPNSSSPAAELKVKAEYFSLRRHCKFDLSLSLLLYAPQYAPRALTGGEKQIAQAGWKTPAYNSTGNSQKLQTRVDCVRSVLGDCPAKERIREAIAVHGVSHRRYPLVDALESVWKLLD